MSRRNRQNRARQQNAQKSTGPKTPQGKAASSQNAVKHGLYAKSIIIDSPQLKEDPDQYAALLASLQQELQPEGAMQNQLVRIIADCFWRRQRVMAAETAYINDQIDDIKPEEIRSIRLFIGDYDTDDEESMKQLQIDVDRRVALDIGKYCIPYERFAKNLLRYEMRLERQLTRTYKLLRDLKKHASSRSPVIPPPIPDDAINDNGPFQGLADLEADPAVSYPGDALDQYSCGRQMSSSAPVGQESPISCHLDSAGLTRMARKIKKMSKRTWIAVINRAACSCNEFSTAEAGFKLVWER